MNTFFRLGTALALTVSMAAWADEIRIDQLEIQSADGTTVPVEIATPAGEGPFPPVLFIHAKRGYVGDERAHIRELAAQGFLVVAPDWQSGRFIERWPSAHDPDTEIDVEAGLDYLMQLPSACPGRSASSACRAGLTTPSAWPPSAVRTSPPSSATTATCRIPTHRSRTSCSASRRRSCRSTGPCCS
jgi:hypothetical protein